jgi:hypothetical protein
LLEGTEGIYLKDWVVVVHSGGGLIRRGVQFSMAGQIHNFDKVTSDLISLSSDGQRLRGLLSDMRNDQVI